MTNKIVGIRNHGFMPKGFKIVPESKIKIPVYTYRVSAGTPSFDPDDSVEETKTFDDLLSVNRGYTSMVYVSGNSMYPELHDQQAIIVDTLIPLQVSSLEELSGKIVVAWHNGGQNIKRLQVINGEAILVPDNPEYEKVRVKKDDDFKIMGVLIYSLKCHY